MKKTFGIILIIPFLIWCGARFWQSQINFNRDCGGYMQNAANANSIELATQQMKEVVKYIEYRRFQPGFTSVVYNTPDEDVGFWMSNMRSSLEELERVKPETSSLEKSNILIKLRETLTHKKEGSSSISVPKGISVYPNNLAFMLWGLFSFFAAIGGVILFLAGLDEY